MKYSLVILSIVFLSSCSQNKNAAESTQTEEGGEYVEYNNPPAEGFDQEGSDLLATLLADKVMLAMGGRKAWDDTRYISWNFFGRRTHIWDKHTGDIRIEIPESQLIILMNIHSMNGKVQRSGEAISNTDSLSTYLTRGKNLWINDSYWLVMPFKLKDSGLTLYYLGEDTTEAGTQSDVLRLTFKDVGVTPDNIYDVWVDVDSKLITQWAYYEELKDEPDFITAWVDYKKYGDILLSGSRGENRELTDIKVLTDVPQGTFDSFEQIVL